LFTFTSIKQALLACYYKTGTDFAAMRSLLPGWNIRDRKEDLAISIDTNASLW